ncbi:MAG TPA: DNA repair protein RecO [Pyrinomonadaceae bacterium]|jgi:DNA repair protein RecO (recombination protein O)
MPLIETESIVLKSYNLAEADRIVVLLTHDHGVVRGVAKGAKRLKSRFGSGLEPFSEVRATYFQKDNIELVSLQRTDLIRSNFAVASEPDFLQKFSYLGDLLISFLPPHDPNEKAYRMVRASIDAAGLSVASLNAVGVYFELWLLKLAGYLPDWSRCDSCGRGFEETEEANVQANYHLLCSGCRRAASNRILDGTARALARDALRLSPAAFVESAETHSESLAYVSRILKDIISHAVGHEVSGEVSLAVPAAHNG